MGIIPTMKLFSLFYICLVFAVVSLSLATQSGFIDDCRGKGDIKEGMKRSAEFGSGGCKPPSGPVEPMP